MECGEYSCELCIVHHVTSQIVNFSVLFGPDFWLNVGMIRFLLIALLSCLCLTSCGFVKKTYYRMFGKKPKIILENRDIRLAGRIEQVNKEGNYVLIRRYGAWRFDATLQNAESRGGARTANLLPTGEKLGEHIAADIRSGEVAVGDAVYIRRIQASQKPKPSTETEKPSLPDNQPKPAETP